MQLPQVYPCVVVLGVFDDKLCLPPLNMELPPTPREVSLGLFLEDGPVLPMGSQLDGDIGEGVRDVTAHHCRPASRHRHNVLGADRSVPAFILSIQGNNHEEDAEQPESRDGGHHRTGQHGQLVGWEALGDRCPLQMSGNTPCLFFSKLPNVTATAATGCLILSNLVGN